VLLSYRISLTLSSANAGFDLFDDELNEARPNGTTNASDFIIDIREYDVPYHVRVAIDKGMHDHSLT
jgi:DNA polymerase epsilon subunit 1